MTIQPDIPADALAVHFDPPAFAETEWAALNAHPLSAPGVCQNPACSKPFAPARDWQVYCCRACRTMGDNEFRRIGMKAAPALLAWRMGKYERSNPDLMALSRAGRRYVSQLQGQWFASRLARVRAAK